MENMGRKLAPFDSLVLQGVCREASSLIGMRIRKLVQVDHYSLWVKFGGGQRVSALFISADPQYPRMYLSSTLEGVEGSGGTFVQVLRAKLKHGKLLNVFVPRFDRVAYFQFGTREGTWTLVAELIGTHSNLWLISPFGRVAGMIRRKGRMRSGALFIPLEGGAESLEEGLREGKGLSPFLQEEVLRLGWKEVLRRFSTGPPVISSELGVYPYQPAQWEGIKVRPQGSLSAALEAYYRLFLERVRQARRRRSLLGRLNRSLNRLEERARCLEKSLQILKEAEVWQRHAELLLAFGADLDRGADTVTFTDWDGNTVEISLEPSLSGIENAEFLFAKAKRARREEACVREKLTCTLKEIEELCWAISTVETGDTGTLERVERIAEQKKWLESPNLVEAPGEKPFEGKKVKTHVSPGGWRILVGGDAEANDYLLHRLAKPHDWWFHVRAGKGAHVLLQTLGQPQKVQRGDLFFAAQLAVRESTWRHSRGVPVDYALAKYVRKPRKAPLGMVVYTHEKTLYVDP